MQPTQVMKDCLSAITAHRRGLEDERDKLITERTRLEAEEEDAKEAAENYDPESDELEPEEVNHQEEIDAITRAEEKLSDLDAQLEEVEEMLR